MNDTINKLQKGYVISDDRISVDSYIQEWLIFIQENRKQNTFDRYSEVYRLHIKDYIGAIKLSELRATHIEKILRKKKSLVLSGSSLQHIYGVLNSALNRALKLSLIDNNVCKYVERPKRDKFSANVLTPDEINFVLGKLDTSNYNDYIVYVALNLVLETGLRRGELAGLEWSNLDYKNNILDIKNNLVYTNNTVVLTTPKTEESQRNLYISDHLIKILKLHHKKQMDNKLFYGPSYKTNNFNDNTMNFIFTWENGAYIHPNYYTVKFKKVLKRVGIDKKVRFHDLRHTNATLLLENGTDFKTIQERLGHSDISTSMNLYAHVNMKMQKNATDKITGLWAKN